MKFDHDLYTCYSDINVLITVFLNGKCNCSNTNIDRSNKEIQQANGYRLAYVREMAVMLIRVTPLMCVRVTSMMKFYDMRPVIQPLCNCKKNKNVFIYFFLLNALSKVYFFNYICRQFTQERKYQTAVPRKTHTYFRSNPRLSERGNGYVKIGNLNHRLSNI